MQDTHDPGHQNQQSRELGAYDDHVIEGLTDGHILVVGHCSQEEDVQPCKECEKLIWVIQPS